MLAIVEEEADETVFWLEIVREMGVYDGDSVEKLMDEGDELLAIVVSSIKTARRGNNPKSKI